MFKSMLAKKIIFLGFSIVVVLIALWLIEQLIQDRLSYKEEARESIANSWSGEQQIYGPILIVPFTYLANESYRDKEDDKYYSKRVERESTLYLVPEHIQFDATMTTQERSKGIFSFPVYTAEIKVAGEFDLSTIKATIASAVKNLKNAEYLVRVGTPYLSVSLSSVRGINNNPKLIWQGNEHSFKGGSQSRFNSDGIHATLANLGDDMAAFSFELSLRGMETLWFTPTAKDTNVKIYAAWPHPNFVGKFLPNVRNIESDKFQANWIISGLSGGNTNNHIFNDNKFGVNLNTPVDIYRLSIRSVKYGILFVGLTFISFFVFEILKKLQIHPVQYTLVALSLSIFYLLLIAFSEAFGFVLAYILATIACVSLLTFYMYSILKNLKWGLIFGGFVASLYTLLYVILNSEDHALLLGSSLVFIVLGLVMVMTRHLDWYKVGERISEKAKEQLNKS